MRKNIIFLFFGLVYVLQMNAQNWNWAKSTFATGNELPSASVTDAAGNLYVTGTFEDSSITFGSFTLVNQGGYDIFFVKYDPAGNIIWAKSFGGISNEWVTITNDPYGNIYL